MFDSLFSLISRRIDLNKPLEKEQMQTLFCTEDALAHRFELTLERDGQPIGLDDHGVVGYFVRCFDRKTLPPIKGTIEDGKAVLTLPDYCYTHVGKFILTIKITKGEVRKAVFCGEASMQRSRTDEVLADESTMDLDALLAMIADMETANADSIAAAQEARDAAAEADAARLAIQDDLNQVKDTIYGDIETLAHNMFTDGWPSNTTFEFTRASGVGAYAVRCVSTASGGRLYVDFDTNKLTHFSFYVYLFDADGNPYKITSGKDVASSGNTNIYYASGDYDESAWHDVMSGTTSCVAVAPFSLPIPDGCTVFFAYALIRNNVQLPDGTLTFTWSSEAEKNGTWVFTWARDGGILTTVKHSIGLDTAVRYTEQRLTEGQKKQARKNIGIGDEPSEDQIAVCNNYAAMFNSMTGRSESFLFFTDPHLASSKGFTDSFDATLNEIKSVYDYAPVSMCVCGGDWLNNGNTKENALLLLNQIDRAMKTRFDKYINLVGNHDTNYQGYEWVQSGYDRNQSALCMLSEATIANLWHRQYGRSYFAVDGDSTRFYVFDTGTDFDSSMNEYRWAQVDWFANALLVDNPERCACLMHIVDSSGAATPLVDAVTKVASAFNAKSAVTINGKTYSFASVTGKCGFVLGGHKHTDLIYTANGIPVVLTANMQYNDAPPIIDLVLVDYGANMLRIVRIGTGNDREVALAT